MEFEGLLIALDGRFSSLVLVVPWPLAEVRVPARGIRPRLVPCLTLPWSPFLDFLSSPSWWVPLPLFAWPLLSLSSSPPLYLTLVLFNYYL